MAVYTEDSAKRGGQCQIPTNRYRVRCLGAKASKINDAPEFEKFELAMEIIDPEVIVIDDQEQVIAGRDFTMYVSLNPNKPRGGLADAFVMLRRLGIDTDGGIDSKKAEAYFKGMEFDAILSSQEEFKRLPRQPGQKVGDFILDGFGNKISNGWKINCFPSDVLENGNPVRNEQIAGEPA